MITDKRTDHTISEIETIFWPKEKSTVKKTQKAFESKKQKEKESIEKETETAFKPHKKSTDKETWKRSESKKEMQIDDSVPTIERVTINEVVSTTNEIETAFWPVVKGNETDKGGR